MAKKNAHHPDLATRLGVLVIGRTPNATKSRKPRRRKKKAEKK